MLQIDIDKIITIAGLLTAIGVIGGVALKLHKILNRFEKTEERVSTVENTLKQVEEEQCMQTYVLEAVLDGLHQLGCNGKTTEASEKLNKFINKRAHKVE